MGEECSKARHEDNSKFTRLLPKKRAEVLLNRNMSTKKNSEKLICLKHSRVRMGKRGCVSKQSKHVQEQLGA